MMEPLSDLEMSNLMAVLGPFEKSPHIAVAVSGGADSMALTLLALKWVQDNGGSLSALSVDHNLRPESGEEIGQVASWLRRYGIDHHCLSWTGTKPQTALQARARAARYDLLGDWCRKNQVLHLLLAHHQEDQAETFLMRLGHGSGLDGLAAMATIIEKPAMRLLRPLLGVPKSRLKATLQAASQPWLEDPSNENMAFERIRIRKSFPDLMTAGFTVDGLTEITSRMARARMALEARVSQLLARCCSLHPAGYARVRVSALFLEADEFSLRALARILMCVGGKEYAPRKQKLEHLHEKMKAAFMDGPFGWKGATLSGCRVLPLKKSVGVSEFLICREGRALPSARQVVTPLEINWDNRFRLCFVGPRTPFFHDIMLQPLGRNGWRNLVYEMPEMRAVTVPVPARMTLPALVDEQGVVAVPHLNYQREGLSDGTPSFSKAVFYSRQTLSGTGFLVAH